MQAWLFCTTGKFCFDNGAAEKGTLLFLSQFFLSGLCHDWAYCWKLLENLLSVPGKWGNVLADCPSPPPPTHSVILQKHRTHRNVMAMENMGQLKSRPVPFQSRASLDSSIRPSWQTRITEALPGQSGRLVKSFCVSLSLWFWGNCVLLHIKFCL